MTEYEKRMHWWARYIYRLPGGRLWLTLLLILFIPYGIWVSLRDHGFWRDIRDELHELWTLQS